MLYETHNTACVKLNNFIMRTYYEIQFCRGFLIEFFTQENEVNRPFNEK